MIISITPVFLSKFILYFWKPKLKQLHTEKHNIDVSLCASLVSDLALRQNIIIEDVFHFAISGHLVGLQPKANSALLQQLHSQLWLQGNNWCDGWRGRESQHKEPASTDLITVVANTHWEICGCGWSPAASSTLRGDRRERSPSVLAPAVSERPGFVTYLPLRGCSWMKHHQCGWHGMRRCQYPPPPERWKQLWTCRESALWDR